MGSVVAVGTEVGCSVGVATRRRGAAVDVLVGVAVERFLTVVAVVLAVAVLVGGTNAFAVAVERAGSIVAIGVCVEVDASVLVDVDTGGTTVLVAVAVGGIAVSVEVAVGGIAVLVEVAVGGTSVLVEVAVGGTTVLVEVTVGGITVPVGVIAIWTDADDELFAVDGSVVDDEMVPAFVMVVPIPAAVAVSMAVIVTLLPAARALLVQTTTPACPTAGTAQLNPMGAVTDAKAAPVGIVSVNTTD